MNISRVSLLCAYICIVGFYPTYGADSQGRLRGQIIAYRPTEMALQVASNIPNEEEFLFKDQNSRIIKLVYRHFGYIRFGVDLLLTAPIMDVAVKRDKSCDETFEEYVHNSPVLKDATTNTDATDPIIYIGDREKLNLRESHHMKCYRVNNDDIRIMQSIR